MYKKYLNAYRHLPPLKQLVISFFLKWIYWLFTWLLAQKFLLDETWTCIHLFVFTGTMALLLTVPFNWKMLKAIFTRSKNHSGQNTES